MVRGPKKTKSGFRLLPKPIKRTDILNAPYTQKNYPAEYNSWKNGKYRARENWSPEFKEFSDFMRHMGPIPGPGCTLDRIDNDDPRYGPGLCRWADKKQQAANRASTHHLNVGEASLMPLPEIAHRMGITASALRRDMKKHGQLRFGSDPREYAPWPTTPDGSRQVEWERRYLRSGAVYSNISRYEFLISEIKRTMEQARSFIEANWDAEGDNDTPEMERNFKIIENGEKWLPIALHDAPLWEAAVKEFNAALFDKQKRRVPGYLVRGREDEDEG